MDLKKYIAKALRRAANQLDPLPTSMSWTVTPLPFYGTTTSAAPTITYYEVK